MRVPASRVTKLEVSELLTFLGANVDVANADGQPDKAEKYRQFQGTVQGLVELVADLPEKATAPAADDADVHIYFDISGSVDINAMFKVIEAEVERVKAVAGVVRRPINVSFTPFTHEIYPGDHTLKVYHAFPNSDQLRDHLSRIPLRGGGTDFHLVWSAINADPIKSARRNVMVTDLEWHGSPEEMQREHPVNIAYAVLPGAKGYVVDYFVNTLRVAGRYDSTPIRFY